MFRINLVTVLTIVAAASGSAQTPWSANATTAVPNFQSNAVVKTTTVDSGNPHGRGVSPRSTPEGAGTSLLYIPVTAPNKNVSKCIGLRASDPMGGLVTAELYSQPRNGAAGGASLLGKVATVGAGYQYREKQAPVTIDYSANSYYIRLTLSSTTAAGTANQPIAFDVSLTAACSLL